MALIGELLASLALRWHDALLRPNTCHVIVRVNLKQGLAADGATWKARGCIMQSYWQLANDNGASACTTVMFKEPYLLHRARTVLFRPLCCMVPLIWPITAQLSQSSFVCCSHVLGSQLRQQQHGVP
jgi:hypothetical protein